MKNLIDERLKDSIQITETILKGDLSVIEKIAQEILDCVEKNHKVVFFGNGGSAADSQHLAAEFIGRFQKERKSIPAIALTTDTSILTALGNDYGFDIIFARQIQGLGQKGDVAFAFSTSGNSKNVIAGVLEAKKIGMKTISFTGCKGGKLASLTDLSFIVPSDNTARIQEAHICVAHIICELVENSL